ncbi:hypothetical protein, partial [Peribacillus butanolivorans]|uniref:hypothetical protein n=1 Tax=Peribacillus butanolivorans TaxID=421767 RepID=UPI0036D8E6BE
MQQQPFNWSNLSIATSTAGAQCLPFVACNAGQNAGQSFSAQPLATNVSAGAQCLPFISCP